MCLPYVITVLGSMILLMAWTFPKLPRNWKEISHEILIRDGFRCVRCGDRTSTLNVHHKIPLSKGGSNRPDNLVTLCEYCHSLEHRHMHVEYTPHLPPQQHVSYSKNIDKFYQDYQEVENKIENLHKPELDSIEQELIQWNKRLGAIEQINSKIKELYKPELDVIERELTPWNSELRKIETRINNDTYALNHLKSERNSIFACSFFSAFLFLIFNLLYFNFYVFGVLIIIIILIQALCYSNIKDINPSLLKCVQKITEHEKEKEHILKNSNRLEYQKNRIMEKIDNEIALRKERAKDFIFKNTKELEKQMSQIKEKIKNEIALAEKNYKELEIQKLKNSDKTKFCPKCKSLMYDVAKSKLKGYKLLKCNNCGAEKEFIL